MSLKISFIFMPLKELIVGYSLSVPVFAYLTTLSVAQTRQHRIAE
jgi:hypothetical protein